MERLHPQGRPQMPGPPSAAAYGSVSCSSYPWTTTNGIGEPTDFHFSCGARLTESQEEWVAPLEKLPLLMVLAVPLPMWLCVWELQKPKDRHRVLERLLAALPNLRFFYPGNQSSWWMAGVIVIRDQDEADLNVRRLHNDAVLVDTASVGSRKWWMCTGLGEEQLKLRIWRTLETERRRRAGDDAVPSNLSVFNVPLTD